MKNNFDEIWNRIKGETDLKTLSDLGQLIEKTQQTISYSKSKNEFPAGWAYLVGKKYGLLTEWIMTGEGPERIGRQQDNREFPILSDLEEWVKEEVSRNPERKIWFEIQVLASFPEFKEWRRKRDEEKDTPPGLLNKKVA